jgi:hypothetical protein
MVEIDGLLAGLAATGPAFEDRLQQPNDLWQGEAMGRAKVGAAARG